MQFRPVNALWAFPPIRDAQCLRRAEITFAGAIVKTIIDVILILLPIPLVLKMTMRNTQRLALLTLLSLGIVVTAAGGVRIYYVHKMYFVSDDRTWYAYSAYFAGCLEHSVGIV